MVHSLNAVCRTPVGYASVKSVSDLSLEDHTPSFFLAETLKYLFLLFDEENWANTHASGFLFSTEGHLVPLRCVTTSVTTPVTPSVTASATTEAHLVPLSPELTSKECNHICDHIL
jgi:hypothetical protein